MPTPQRCCFRCRREGNFDLVGNNIPVSVLSKLVIAQWLMLAMHAATTDDMLLTRGGWV